MTFRFHYRRNSWRGKSTLSSANITDEDGKLDIANRLRSLLDKIQTAGPVAESDRQFIGSIADFFQRKSYLSPLQYSSFERTEKKYNTTTDETWKQEYDSEKQRQFKIAVQYYRGLRKYYTSIVARAVSDPNFVPERSLFDRLVNNKFVQRIIREYDAPAKFEVGQLVSLKLVESNRQLKHTWNIDTARALNNTKHSPVVSDYYDPGASFVPCNPSNLWIVTGVNVTIPFAGRKGSKIYSIHPVCAMSDKAKQLHPYTIVCEECNLERVKG